MPKEIKKHKLYKQNYIYLILFLFSMFEWIVYYSMLTYFWHQNREVLVTS